MMVLNLFLGYNIYNKMAKNKKHDKIIHEYEKKKSTEMMNRTIEKAEKWLGRGYFEQ